jgi:hypothetical protein
MDHLEGAKLGLPTSRIEGPKPDGVCAGRDDPPRRTRALGPGTLKA